MLDKKTSNVLSLLALGWVAALVILFYVQRQIGFIDANAALLWHTEMGVTLLLPLLVIFANSRNEASHLPRVDQALQLLFYAAWIVLGLTFAFTENGSYLFALAVALLLLFAVLIKAVFGKKPAKSTKGSSEISKTTVLLALNALTIWVPLGYLLGATIFIATAYAGFIDSGLAIIPIYRMFVPFFIVGAVIAVLTIVWLVVGYLKNRPKVSRKSVILGAVWILASVAYLAVWILYIMPVVTSFQLL